MNFTTVQQVYLEFRTCDGFLDSEEDFADLDLLQESSIALDDDRAFSNASDFSDITYAKLPSNTSHTKSLKINDERSFSNVSNCSQGTSENLELSDTSVTTLMDELEDRLLESSNSFFDDHVISMVVSLAASRHRASKIHSIPTEVR
jgi:hypothetical protein